MAWDSAWAGALRPLPHSVGIVVLFEPGGSERPHRAHASRGLRPIVGRLWPIAAGSPAACRFR
ncbi:hypothetical protein J2W46_004760 [Paraburkholderia strydomiana]|nr:hypothetical protein [Paraburkholderia strydomiana]